MSIDQQQSTSNISTDEICTEVSRLLYNIISENQEDDTVELLRLKLDVKKTAGNLNKFVKVLHRHVSGVLIEKFIEQLIKKYTTEEQRKAFIREACKVLLDTSPNARITEEFIQILNKEHVTETQMDYGKVMNEYGDTPLHLAVEQGDLNAVKHLVEKGGDINVKNKYGSTPLHVASIRGNLEIAQFLLDNGANVNAQAINGYAPLYLAIVHDHLAMVKLLLDHCADVNIKEGDSNAEHNFGYGTTPLILTAVNCNTEIAKLLLNNGADVSIKTRGLTALDFASTKDECPEMLTLLKDGNIKSSRSNCITTAVANSAVKPYSFINSVFSWIGASTTAALGNLFQSTSIQQPVTYSGENSISSSQAGFSGMTFLADVTIRKFTGEKYSRPLDDSLLTLEQIKERKLSAIERDVKMSISKFEHPDQCRSSLSNITILKAIDCQKQLSK